MMVLEDSKSILTAYAKGDLEPNPNIEENTMKKIDIGHQHCILMVSKGSGLLLSKRPQYKDGKWYWDAYAVSVQRCTRNNCFIGRWRSWVSKNSAPRTTTLPSSELDQTFSSDHSRMFWRMAEKWGTSTAGD